MSKAQIASQRFSVSDYLGWPENERWELIGGIAYNMSPAPSIRHQDIAGGIYTLLRGRLKGKSCRPFIAPVDVILSESDVVQPDVLVVCDPAKITPNNIQGAPDLVVEVLSPNTSRRDLREKKALYQQAGVAEYLVIDPLELYVQAFRLEEGGQYGEGKIFGPDEILPLCLLQEEGVPLAEIFT
jgi:Uma2 family endonuclease